YGLELAAIGMMLASCNGKIVVGELDLPDAATQGTASPDGTGAADVDSGSAVDASCGSPPPATDVHPSGRAVPVYLAASAATPADTDSKLSVFEKALIAVQIWFGQQMGTTYQLETFHVEAPRALASRYSRGEWDDFAANGFKDAAATRCGL